MKVVLDTNTLISAAIAKGKPRKLLIKGVSGEIEIITSNELLSELEDVIKRSKFKLSKSEIEKFISTIKETIKFVKVKSSFKVVKEDPDDDLVINTAYDGKVDYLVSGDPHLLNLKEFRGIEIATADKMLKVLRLSKE